MSGKQFDSQLPSMARSSSVAKVSAIVKTTDSTDMAGRSPVLDGISSVARLLTYGNSV